MATVTMSLEEYNQLRQAAGFAPVGGDPSQMVPASMELNSPVTTLAPKKRKRRPSKYNRAYGANYKKLRKKHPRAKHATLVTRAHAATRREMKKK